MSGHSKWANIKNRKGAVDKKRSEVFTKASKNIMTALRSGNTVSIKAAIDQAKSVNMPRENIERLQNRYIERKENLVYCRF
jgi:transcriptional/translational regulatory protein YebC/TACO1